MNDKNNNTAANRLENRENNYLIRYFSTVKEILSNPKAFFSLQFETPVTTSIKFYLLTHYLLFLITLPIVNRLLERMQLYLRLKGFLNLADMPVFNENYYILANTFFIPILTVFFWYLASVYFRIIASDTDIKTQNLMAIFITNHTATAIPTVMELLIIYFLDSLWPEGSMWMGFAFFSIPLFYAAVMLILVGKALKVRHENTERLKLVIFANIITFVLLFHIIFIVLMK